MCGINRESLTLQAKNIAKGALTIDPIKKAKRDVDSGLDPFGTDALQGQKQQRGLDERQARIDASNAATITNAPLHSLDSVRTAKRKQLNRSSLLTDSQSTLLT